MISSAVPKDSMLDLARALYGEAIHEALMDLDGLDGAVDLWRAYRAVAMIASIQEQMVENQIVNQIENHPARDRQGHVVGDAYLSVSVEPCGFRVEIRPWKAARMRLMKTLETIEPLAIH